MADERDVGRLYPVAKRVLTPLFHRLWDIDVEGVEHVPPDGGAIICANHTSVIDSFFLPLVLPRRIMFVGKAEYLDDWKTRQLFPALGMIPIDRSGGSASERALNTAARVMNARYPAELVRHPLPPDCDLRRLFHADVDERSQDVARAVFNQRLAQDADVRESQVAVDLDGLSSEQRIEVFMAVFFLYGTKIGALQNRTGIR